MKWKSTTSCHIWCFWLWMSGKIKNTIRFIPATGCARSQWHEGTQTPTMLRDTWVGILTRQNSVKHNSRFENNNLVLFKYGIENVFVLWSTCPDPSEPHHSGLMQYWCSVLRTIYGRTCARARHAQAGMDLCSCRCVGVKLLTSHPLRRCLGPPGRLSCRLTGTWTHEGSQPKLKLWFLLLNVQPRMCGHIGWDVAALKLIDHSILHIQCY